jgi:hypothetical protein
LLSVIIGGCVVIIGQIIHFISAGYLIKKDELTTAGPYRFTRNPFYVGNLFYDLGLCVIAQNIYVAVVYLPIFYLGVIRTRIKREEAFLLTKFGQDYEEYRRKVPRFIPRIYPARLNKIHGQFTWGQIIRNRELWRVMRAIGLILILYLKSVVWLPQSNLSSLPDRQAGLISRLSSLVSTPINLLVIICLGIIVIVPPVVEFLIIQSLRKHSQK